MLNRVILLLKENRSIEIIMRGRESFWRANEERIVIVMTVIMALIAFGLIFSPFSSWIKGYTLSYLVGFDINGMGSGTITYMEDGQLKQRFFTCPDIVFFSFANVGLGFVYLYFAVKMITGRFGGEEDIPNLYKTMSGYMFVLAVVGIGMGFIFLLTYKNLSIQGLGDIQRVGDLVFYLKSMGIQPVFIGPSLGIIITIIFGVLNVFFGIILTILGAEASKKEK